MATDKAKATAKKTATTKASATEKGAAKPVVKRVIKEPERKPKVKVVRDFSMPQAEYQKIAEIKETCLKAGLRVKKGEVLRAGLKALGEMNGAQLKRAMSGFGKIRAARPKKP